MEFNCVQVMQKRSDVNRNKSEKSEKSEKIGKNRENRIKSDFSAGNPEIGKEIIKKSKNRKNRKKQFESGFFYRKSMKINRNQWDEKEIIKKSKKIGKNRKNRKKSK